MRARRYTHAHIQDGNRNRDIDPVGESKGAKHRELVQLEINSIGRDDVVFLELRELSVDLEFNVLEICGQMLQIDPIELIE